MLMIVCSHLETLDDTKRETYASSGPSVCHYTHLQPYDLCRHLSEGEQRIQDAKAAFFRTLDDQRKLRRKLNQRNDLLLGKLLVELAYRIFQLSVPLTLTLAEFREQLTINSRLSFTSPQSLLKLRAICRSWRRVKSGVIYLSYCQQCQRLMLPSSKNGSVDPESYPEYICRA
ncbi:hypothetical protein CPB83DRAFT_846594 [Crepidotus variabilis]|uniref:Uncharacterized protein n=1 Tax=Crepidotus variabilis TaxID=179855 RepID=A0A9P6JTB3_9AGAR|nr:hypothetical protein CPB83DRAFT_846594 [Crepidotus variabilis]